jgi:hypothetical protein
MDFISGFPKSGLYDGVMVVVDKFSRFAHFIPISHPYTAIVSEVLIQWSGMSEVLATCEDSKALHQHFPAAPGRLGTCSFSGGGHC